MMPNMNATSPLAESSRNSDGNPKKRSRTEEDEDVHLTPEALAQMSRSERKKFREKKRRSDVNKGFDDLIELLVEIDPVVRAEHEDRMRRGATEEHLLSRVELIGRTVEVLRRVHRENEERKLIIQQLLQSKPATAASVTAAPAVAAHPSPMDKQMAVSPQNSILGARQAFAGFGAAGVTQNPMMLSRLGAAWQQQRVGGTTITTYLPGAMDFSMLAAAAAANTNNATTQVRSPLALPVANSPSVNLRSVVSEALSRYTEQTTRRSPREEK